MLWYCDICCIVFGSRVREGLMSVLLFCIIIGMSEKRTRKVTVELNPVEMVWLHSQHLFQKIEESSYSQNQIKFFKNNNGVQIRFQGSEGEPSELTKARQQLLKVINSNEIRLITTSLHKDNYIRISKQTRKEFPKSYIIFLHYETFENCSRKLHQKFNITSIAPELQRLRKNNPYFCFLIAEKQKIDDIEKFTKRILNSELSCASTTFSQRREAPPTLAYKRTMSVSSLRGSFSDHEEQCRISVHQNPVEQQFFEMSQSVLVNLQEQQMRGVVKNRLYQGCLVSIQRYEGTYSCLLKKLYYANRLQLTANPYMQPIFAYNMMEKTSYHWGLTLLTDQHYSTLKEVMRTQWMASIPHKIEVLMKVGRGLSMLHKNMQSYGGLSEQTVLFDDYRNVFLRAAVQKQIPPHTNPKQYDVRKYLMLMYWLLTETRLTYDMLVFKMQNQEFFCTLSHRAKNKLLKQFLEKADKLFIAELTLDDFLDAIEKLKQEQGG